MEDNQSIKIADIGLTLGLLSIMVLGAITAVPGIIIGHIARSKTKKDSSTYGSRGKALVGLILSYLGLIASIGGVLYYIQHPEVREAMQTIQHPRSCKYY